MILFQFRRRSLLLALVLALSVAVMGFRHLNRSPKAKEIAASPPAPPFSAIATAISSPWLAFPDDTSGLPVVGKGGAAALSASFVFWGNNWRWADLQTKFKTEASNHSVLTGENRALDFTMTGKISQEAAKHRLVWEFDLDARKAVPEVIGGGMEFKFDLATFGAELGEPVLLADNRGWAWGREGGSRMEMVSEPALAAVYFERGERSRVRAFFYQGRVDQGRQHYTITLTLSNNMAMVPPVGERFGKVDPTSWQQELVDWRLSPVDLSFLNSAERPAGRRGFVQAQGEQLIFADGTPARFWGTNITAATLFATPKEMVRQQARRLSALGFNLVRLHHHDSSWVKPNIFGVGNGSDTGQLDAKAQESLDWWINCLKEEGIYVWLDLHVGRNLMAGDGIEGFGEMAKGKVTAELKGYNYVNPDIRAAMERFDEAYVNHLNPYTKTRYQDEPAIAAMLITNENDLTHHFGNALLPDKRVPFHNQIYMAEAADFARQTGLPADKTWRAWENGPAKIFLNDLEHRFNRAMIAHLRTLGVKVPIVTTSTWGANPLSSLPALTTGDLIDVHAYGGVGELEKNPLVAANLMHWLAAGQVVGMPMSVSEWNVSPFPTPDRHALPLYVAGSACLQAWDAVLEYAYSQGPLNSGGVPSNWEAFNDPALLATLPAAALLYRQGHVREATTTTVLALGREAFFSREVSPATSVALRTAAEQGKLLIALPKTKELPWLQPRGITAKGAQITGDPDKPLLDARAAEAASDTGELRRNWNQGIYTINTLRTQAAMGWIGGERIALPEMEIALSTKNATVAVQTLDGQPISRSQRILISLGARSVPAAGNTLPFISEPVLGRLWVRAPAGLKLWKHVGQSGKREEVPVVYEAGAYRCDLDGALRTYWLVLEKR